MGAGRGRGIIFFGGVPVFGLAAASNTAAHHPIMMAHHAHAAIHHAAMLLLALLGDDLDLLRKSGEFPMKDEELRNAEETIYEGI